MNRNQQRFAEAFASCDQGLVVSAFRWIATELTRREYPGVSFESVQDELRAFVQRYCQLYKGTADNEHDLAQNLQLPYGNVMSVRIFNYQLQMALVMPPSSPQVLQVWEESGYTSEPIPIHRPRARRWWWPSWLKF